ncbi:hypothetical protein ACROYT_G036758 [Oculina patagonica]
MFVTSAQKQIMSSQQQNAESERQHLLERLLDAVKQCQVRFGGKRELATDGDSRVVCLLTQLEAIFQHGFKKSRVSAFRQVGQVAGIVKLDSDSVFWNFVKGHLGNLEVDRFLALEKATTDAGRGRAWLRSALNEHSLERFFHNMLGDKTLISHFYEKEAFFMDEERASMLPMIAAGLSPILFALTVDSEELNIAPVMTINKDMFSNILPSFPQKPVVEPAPVYSAELTDESKQEKKRKKKKKKKKRSHCVYRRGRSSSYPGNITVVSEGFTEKRSHVNGQEILFTEITKSISLPDNSVVENIAETTSKDSKNSSFDLEDFLENVTVKPRYDTVGVGVQETITGEDSGNFVFNAEDLFLKQPKVDSEERTSLQFQNATKNDNNKAISSGSPTALEAAYEPMRQIQGDITTNERDFLENPNVSEGKSCGTSFSNTKQYISQGREVLPQREQNLDSFHVYSLTKNESSNESNFSMAQMQAPTVVEKRTSDIKAANESQGSTPVNLEHCHKVDVKEDFSSAQKSQDFRQSPSGKAFQQNRTENREELEENDFRNDLYDYEAGTTSPGSQSGTNDSSIEPVVLLDSGEPLVPLSEGGETAKTGAQSTFYCAPDVSTENDRDSLSSTSWSYIEDGEEFSEQKDDSLPSNRSAMSSDASAAAAALAACSDAQRGMDSMSRGFVAIERTTRDQSGQRDYSSQHDGMSTGELKQAIVSMMLRKDEIEEKNRNLQTELDEERHKSQQLSTETDALREELKEQENFNTAKIESLSRENELLKHQLKKYVGAVQALRSDLHGKSSEAVEVLSGIRQDDVLPPLPPERNTEQDRQSDEAEEYKSKLIQVADLHGELLEFNERLHKQVNYYQYQVRRLREELVNLRGPLPEDLENSDDARSLSDFDPAVMSVGTRPLVNVWIPSVFLRGRSSSVHHVYQVYVRIKDDEWNVYRRYSQFFEMHKNLRRKFAVVDNFKFPPKKTLGNKDSRFVEDRRRLLQDYLRRVVNLYVTTDQGLRSDTTKTTLLQILPFFADLPPEKTKKETSKRKRSVNYTGL